MALLEQFLTLDPVYNDLRKIDFGNDILNHLITSISKDTMVFSVNIINKRIEPLDTILNYLKKNKKIKFIMTTHDKTGNNLFSFILYDFHFVKINNLLDFNYNVTDIMKLSVTFDFNNLEYINSMDELQVRKSKISKLLNKSDDFLNKSDLI